MDGSPVWLHIYAVYTGGRNYTLASSLVVPPVVSVEFAEMPAWCIEAKDHREITWKVDSMELDGGFFELDNAVLRVFCYEGWLETKAKTLVPSFLRYKLRITQFAGSPFIKCDCSVVMADKMADNRIEWIRVRFPELKASQGVTVRTMLDGTIQNKKAPVFIQQSRFNKTDIKGIKRANGVIEATGYAICVRNFWEKYPQALSVKTEGLAYYQWYGKGSSLWKSG